MPVISLVTDPANFFNSDTGIYVPGIHYDSSNPFWTGNYFQTGIEWERDIYIQYFDKNGNFTDFESDTSFIMAMAGTSEGQTDLVLNIA